MIKAMKAFVFVGGLAILAAAVPASAHHSFPATYFIDRQEAIEGTVVQFAFRNPHSFLHVMAPDQAGKMQRWAIEWGGGAALSKDRVTSTTLKPGDKVKIKGNPGRTVADHRMRMQEIERPQDGWSWKGDVQ